MRRAVAAAVLVAAVALAWAPAASAHAVLEETTPKRGATVDRSPASVSFRFNEPVEGGFGAVRVYDARGRRVDSGSIQRPGGRGDTVAIALRTGLPDGSYTATYRLVSADGHPVSGGFVFSVGRPGSAASVEALLGDDAGPATDAGLGAAKVVSYAAIALAAGGALFLLAVWLPALRAVAGDGPGWPRASEAFVARFRGLGLLAAGAGMVASAAGIALQGAVAGATSLWTALDPDVIGDVLGTRFGTAWGLRILAFAVLAGLLLMRAAGPVVAAVALVAVAYLVVSPALAGHAATQDPSLVLVPANVAHVASMSAWTGGLAMLALVLPAATRALEAADRTRLLASVVARFSTLALVAVGALLLTGIVQSIVYLEELGDLTATAFGRALLVKAGLFLGLVGLGAYNRTRLRPRLLRLAAGGESPGRDGVALRRSLRSELALVAGVLVATAALTAYAPPGTEAAGPWSESTRLGPARAELTLDPASVGRNELHLYLFHARTGAQYDRVKELDLELTLPSRDIGPLPLRARKAGPGHYVVPRADIAPAGDWRLRTAIRVSAFDSYEVRLEVPVE